MRIAAAYGPEAVDLGRRWGGLCERSADTTGKAAYRKLARKCYLRAAVVANDRAAWQRLYELEAGPGGPL